jgi:hypothetical protein
MTCLLLSLLVVSLVLDSAFSSSPIPGDSLLHISVDYTQQGLVTIGTQMSQGEMTDCFPEFTPWSHIATWSYNLRPGTSGKIPNFFVVEICHKYVKNIILFSAVKIRFFFPIFLSSLQVSANLNATFLTYQGSFGFTSTALRFDNLEGLEWGGRGVAPRIAVIDIKAAAEKMSMWAARAGDTYTEQDMQKIRGPGAC